MGDEVVEKKLVDTSNAMAYLYDITVCSKVYLKAEAFFKVSGNGRFKVHFINSYSIRMNFNQFLEYPEQLEAQGILLNTGDENKKPFELIISEAEVTNLKNGQTELKATLTLPENIKNKLQRGSKVIVALRLHIDEKNNTYFPYPMHNEPERYLGTLFGATRGPRNTRREVATNLKYESLEVLKEKFDSWLWD